MRNPERLIFIPQGDSNRPDQEGVVFRQAKRLAGDLRDQAWIGGWIAVTGVKVIARFPWETPRSFVRWPVTYAEGCLVCVRTIGTRNRAENN